MKFQHISAFLLASTTVGVLTSPDDAEATWRRRSSMSCTTEDVVWRSQMGINNYGNSTIDLYCSLDDDSDFRVGDIQTLNVHGYDAMSNVTVSARTCITRWNSWSGTCAGSGYSGTSYVGSYGLSLPLTEFTTANAADFSYVHVSLPPGGNSVSGYFYAD